jgi:hypothetical protein
VSERPDHELTQADEPAEDTDASLTSLDPDDADEGVSSVPSWLGAIGQMFAAVLVVVALVALFIGTAVAFRRLLP